MHENINNNGLGKLLKTIMIEEVPSYANKIYYSLGFLSMISFVMLLITGLIMVFFGPNWWITSSVGVYIRSIHLWSVQAFVIFIMLHICIVFLTGGYKPPRRFVWVLGSLMFFLALIEAEFGYVLRNDFSSQWRSLQGADLYNGSGLGKVINNLNYSQIYGIHIFIFPFIILAILFLHYGLVRLRGIAKPFKKEVTYTMVKANHTLLFIRGFVLVCLILILASIFPSPLIAPITIQQIATEDPSLMAKTLLSELDHSSDTATYLDTIDPYQFDTRQVYVAIPYAQYSATKQQSKNMYTIFSDEDTKTQENTVKSTNAYFASHGQLSLSSVQNNPLIQVISALIQMGQSGLYEASLKNEIVTEYNPTYVLRFLSDTGVLEDTADKLQITTPQYGMLREENGIIPPGAWWLAPLGLLDNTILKNDDNQDRDGAEILGISMLLFIAFPYIPFLNRLPDILGVYTFIWKEKRAQKNS